MARAQIHVQLAGPRPSAMASASTSEGNAISTSSTREIARVGYPAPVAGGHAEQAADDEADDGDAEPDLQRDLSPVQDAGEHVVPFGSVPRMWPGENGGRPASRMLPPTGLGDRVDLRPDEARRGQQDQEAERQPDPQFGRRAACSFPRGRGCDGAGCGTAGQEAGALIPGSSGRVPRTADRRPTRPLHHPLGEHQHDALDDGHVVVVDGRDQDRAHARQREDRLDDGHRPDEHADG